MAGISEAEMSEKICIRLLSSLKDLAGGTKVICVKARSWRAALLKLKEMFPKFSSILDENGTLRPGYIMFIDGMDYRIYESMRTSSVPRDIVILPVNHGGLDFEKVSWEDIENMVRHIAGQIEKSAFKAEVVIGILRGGIIPAKLLADELGVEDMGIIEIKFYRSVGNRSQRPYLRQPLTLPVKDKNVLIVDDVSDSGLTLSVAIDAINLYSPKRLRTATLYVKPWTRLMPDYYSRTSDKWIIFPWERKEIAREIENFRKE